MLSEYEKSQLIDVDVDFFLVLCNKKQGATKCVNNGQSCYLMKTHHICAVKTSVHN